MKSLVLFLAIVACVFADFEYKWSEVKRREIRLPLPFSENILPEGRIVGGNEIAPNSANYQAAILISTAAGTFFCGATILSPITILTAAHCVEDATQVQVIVGAHQVLQNEVTQQSQFTTQFLIHPAWNSLALTNDLALIQLVVPLVFNDNVGAILLPTRSEIGQTFSGVTSRITGWGLESDNSNAISEVLRYVIVDVIANLLCNIFFLGVIQTTHICTSGTDGRGACSGDSGGALVVAQTGAPAVNGTQIGIVSFGIGLGCEIGWPSAFTRVTSFLDWIEYNSDVVIQP